jgi:hypothetical protein
MVRTINLTTDIPLNREVRIMLPPDVPTGPAELVVVVAPRAGFTAKTLGDLAHSEFFGLWRDRTDLGDSVEYARQLRTEAWRRAA